MIPSWSWDSIEPMGLEKLIGLLNSRMKLLQRAISSQEGVNAPTLLNGWVNFGGVETPAGYYKDTSGRVHLRGFIKSGTAAADTVLFTLPIGYRPSVAINFAVVSNNAFGYIDILASGNVRFQVGSNVSLSLDGISFRAA